MLRTLFKITKSFLKLQTILKIQKKRTLKLERNLNIVF